MMPANLTPTVFMWSPNSSVYYIGTEGGSVHSLKIAPENTEEHLRQLKLQVDRLVAIVK